MKVQCPECSEIGDEDDYNSEIEMCNDCHLVILKNTSKIDIIKRGLEEESIINLLMTFKKKKIVKWAYKNNIVL